MWGAVVDPAAHVLMWAPGVQCGSFHVLGSVPACHPHAGCLSCPALATGVAAVRDVTGRQVQPRAAQVVAMENALVPSRAL